MQKIILKIVIVFTLLSTAISCKKNVNGCTDPAADNYKIEANKDDGSCNFHGYLTPWYNTVTRDSLLANNIASVNVSVDDEIFSSYYPVFSIWSEAPDCSTSTIGNWITMQDIKTKSITLTVTARDSNNIFIRQWNETLVIGSEMCELYEIMW